MGSTQAVVKRTYVIALDRGQFLRWCYHHGFNPRDPTIYYVRDFTSLYGLGFNKIKIVYLDNWYLRKDAEQILLTVDALRRANGTKKESRKMDGVFSWRFWKDSLERMIKAFAVSILSLTGADGTNILSSDIGDKLLIAAGAAVISLLISLIGTRVGDSSDPSFVK